MATLIPSSTVNVMSHEDDWYFQCQESGHIAWHCPNVHCSECDKYGHIVVDCLHWIPPYCIPAHHHRLKSHTRHHTRLTSHHHHQDRYRHSRSRSQAHPCRYCSHSCCDSFRRCSRSHHRDNRHYHRSTSWCPHSSNYCSHHDTPHCRLSSHRSSSTHSWDQSRSHSCSAYKPSKQGLHKSSTHPSRPQDKLHNKRNPRVMIDDPHRDFYSSDDNTGDSKDDLYHLT